MQTQAGEQSVQSSARGLPRCGPAAGVNTGWKGRPWHPVQTLLCPLPQVSGRARRARGPAGQEKGRAEIRRRPILSLTKRESSQDRHSPWTWPESCFLDVGRTLKESPSSWEGARTWRNSPEKVW